MAGNFPKFLSIQTTSFCNGRCIFCPAQEAQSRFGRRVMQEQIFRKIIDECAKFRSVERLILYLNNEPLTDPHLVQRINYAKSRVPWAAVHLLTNAGLLTKDLALELIDSRLDWIGFSFQGIRKDTYEKVMGLDYTRTLDNVLRFIKEAKMKRNVAEFIMVTFLGNKYLSAEERDEAVNFWKSQGIERVSYFESAISRAGNVKSLPAVRHAEIHGCNSIWANEMIHIVENADVIACCMDWNREVILGNLSRQSIAELWNSSDYASFREKRDGKKVSAEDFICKRCEAAVIAAAGPENEPGPSAGPPEILLVNLPVWGVEMPPLGLASIVSHLNSLGLKAKPLDLNIEVFHNVGEELKKLWSFSYAESWDDPAFFTGIKGLLERYIEYCVERILAFPVGLIGFSVYSPNRFFTIEVIKRLKKTDPSRVVIAGGRGVVSPADRGIFPEETADYFVVGEGEEVLAKWAAEFIRQRQAPRGIPGVLNFKERLENVELSVNDDLDKIAFPDYRGFVLEKYREKALPVLLSRGCISSCAFCNDWRLIGKFRQRKASEVIREIEHHVKEYGITHFYFNDPAINGNAHELEKFCDLVIEKKLSITWIALAIPMKGLKPDLLKKMKQAGCLTLNFGVESGSDKVLRAMRKLFTVQEAREVLRDTRLAGINTQINFIFGFPGEGEKEFGETLDFIRNNKENICGVTNLNTCNAVFGSDLSLFPERFAISFPADQLLRDSGWECGSDNTFAVRKERAAKAIAFLKDSGIKLFTSNVAAKDKERNRELIATLKRQKTGDPDILILMCPMWATDMPALGISYLFAFLRRSGFSAEIMDINAELFRKSREKELWDMQNYRIWNDWELFSQNIIQQRFGKEIDRFVQRILDKNPLSVGFSVNAGNLLFSLELARRIKERQPGKIIIFGGPHVKWFKHDISSLDRYKDFYGGFYPGLVDIFISGEAEQSLAQVLAALKSNAPIENIPNTIIYKQQKHLVSPQTTYVVNLDDLAFPDFSWAESGDYTSRKYPILLGRGCIRKCAFCNDTFVSEKFRTRSASNVFSEILSRVRESGACHFEFCDLILNGSLKELESLCDLMIRKKLNITWSGQMAIREGMSQELFSKLRQAGFTAVTFGLESFSNKVLTLMNKPYNFDLALATIKNAAKSGIAVHVNIVAGFPGESEADFQETVDKLKKLSGYLKGISSLAPCLITLGSDLQRNQEKYGIIMPEKEGYFRWYTLEGNDYNLRKRRAKAILEAAGKMNIPVGIVNLYDEEVNPSADEPCCKPEGKTDLLLVTLPPWGVDSPPIGLGYLEAYVRGKGLHPRVMDLNVLFHNAAQDEYKKLWHLENKNFWSDEKTFPLVMEVFEKELEQAVKEIAAMDTELIGFSVVDPKEKITAEVINRVRKIASGKKIILGGPACSTEEQRDFFIRHVPGGIDYFVVGEGEETLYQIIKNGGTNAKNNILPGLAIKKNGKWSHLPREPIQPLDSVPFPDYQGFNLDSYVAKKSLLVEWSRGCLGRCSFCKNYRLTSGYRHRSGERVMEEIRTLVSKHGIKKFTVCDNLLNGNIAQLKNVCESVIQENIIIEWSGQIAPRKEMDLELFNKMYRAGCRKIQIGVESGSDSVLKAMRKIYSSATAQSNIRMAKKAGMEVEIFIMVGFPGEGRKEFQKTCDFLRRNRRFIDRVKSINTLHLIAGTDIYEHYRDYGLEELPKENWHYLWRTREGNTYELRKARARALVDLAACLGLPVMETNIQEGKEKALDDSPNTEASLDFLKQQINRLQELPEITGQRKAKIMPHAFYKFLLLGGIFFYSLFYILYFWAIKKVKGKSILGEE